MPRTCNWCGEPANQVARITLKDGSIEDHKAACIKHETLLLIWAREWNQEHFMFVHVLEN